MFRRNRGRSPGKSRASATLGARRLRCGERGLTLIEMLVTVVVIAVGVVGIAGALAETQHASAINQDQSQLEVAMRQLSDWVRDSSSASCSATPGTCPNLPYSTCAQVSTYAPAVTSAVSAGALSSGPQFAITKVNESVYPGGGTRKGSVTPPLPGGVCSAQSPVTGDWGVQEITLKVSDSRSSLTRIVWKSSSW
jgi:prepilin-type N-terminal cleavage/methylation domain-containing protein